MDTTNQDGLTMLMILCNNLWTPCMFKTVKQLIEESTDVNVQTPEGDTALHYVCHQKHTDITDQVVTLLLDHGADVNLQDDTGYTPLMVAVYGKYNLESTIKILINRGADLNKQGFYSGSTALMIYLQSNRKLDVETVKLLVEHTNLELEQTNTKNTALILAVKKRVSNDILNLLTSRSSVNKQNKKGYTALHYASIKSYRITKFLIEKGFNVNIQDKRGNTPLHLACYCKSYSNVKQTVQLLLDSNAKINIQNNKGKTPLMYASDKIQRKNTVSRMNMLIRRGCSLDLKDKNKRTVLINLLNMFRFYLSYDSKIKKMIKTIIQYKHNLSSKEVKALKSYYIDAYLRYITEKTVKDHIKKTNQIKLIKFINLRKQQIDCDPTSYKVQMKKMAFDINNGNILVDDLFLTVDTKMKDHFNIHTKEDLITVLEKLN